MPVRARASERVAMVWPTSRSRPPSRVPGAHQGEEPAPGRLAVGQVDGQVGMVAVLVDQQGLETGSHVRPVAVELLGPLAALDLADDRPAQAQAGVEGEAALAGHPQAQVPAGPRGPPLAPPGGCPVGGGGPAGAGGAGGGAVARSGSAGRPRRRATTLTRPPPSRPRAAAEPRSPVTTSLTLPSPPSTATTSPPPPPP